MGNVPVFNLICTYSPLLIGALTPLPAIMWLGGRPAVCTLCNIVSAFTSRLTVCLRDADLEAFDSEASNSSPLIPVVALNIALRWNMIFNFEPGI